jgi:hypothetical protein
MITRRWTAARTLVSTCVVTAALGVLAVACDEVYANPVTTSPPGPFVPDSGGLRVTRTPPIQCPRGEVTVNQTCAQPSGRCEYGGSPDGQCNTIYVCSEDSRYGAYWSEQSAPRCALACPEDPSLIVEGAPCDVADAGGDEAELHCTAAQRTCMCTTGRDGNHAHPRKWVCITPDQDCPAKRPLLGQPCFGSRACDYGACLSKRGMRMICADDVWQTEGEPCAD